jgi:hypothetical protein
VSEPIRLYLDEDTISRALMNALRARGVDILSAHDAGMVSAADSDHLMLATELSRTIFTFNTRHFARLHGEFIRAGHDHAGIIVSDQMQVGEIVRRLARLIHSLSAQDMGNRIEFLSSWR